MPGLLPLAIISFITTWLLFFVGIIFYQEGDDKRTLLFAASTVLIILSTFSMLIPTYTIVHIPAYNVTTISSSNSITEYPALNKTIENPPYSNPIITLYTIFAVFQAFIFFIFMIWSLRYRLQYKTFKQYENEMRKIKHD